MKTDEQEYAAFRRLCRSHGCKCTPQRLAVFRYVHGNLAHPCVNEIWSAVRREVPSITRESVFRILLELSELGVVTRLDKVIDARFDGRPEEHGHLLCERCGKILDFDLPAGLPPLPVPPGFQAHHREIRISGLCASCAESSTKQTNQGETDNGTERK